MVPAFPQKDTRRTCRKRAVKTVLIQSELLRADWV